MSHTSYGQTLVARSLPTENGASQLAETVAKLEMLSVGVEGDGTGDSKKTAGRKDADAKPCSNGHVTASVPMPKGKSGIAATDKLSPVDFLHIQSLRSNALA